MKKFNYNLVSFRGLFGYFLKLNNRKTRALVKTILPSTREISIVCRGLFFIFVVSTFIYLFQYSGYQLKANAQSSTTTNAQFDGMSGAFNHINNVLLPPMIGCGGSNFATTVGGADQSQNILCRDTADAATDGSKPTGYLQPLDLGATGRFINSTSYFYDEAPVEPGQTVQYYADKITGKTLAADRTNGREVLAPMFWLSNLTKNIAYGLIVIVLVISSMSILLGYLSGAEQKLSLVQLMLNCGFALLFITLFYEISAIIYDLTVNYGNAFVASVMEPYINAKFILERLEPGGDLNATALLNVYQFSGVSEGLITVANNVFMGLQPAISQTIDAFSRNAVNDLPMGIGKLAGFVNGLAGGAVTFGASTLISSLLGSQAVFNCIIAFVFFTINFKIWANLLIAFVSYNLYVGFGPLMMLSAVNKGYDEIKGTFKALVSFGLVFPVTFFFILLGATVMNFFIREGTAGTVDIGSGIQEKALCVYSSQDPTRAELDSSFDRHTIGAYTGIGSDGDPRAFKRNWNDFQDIYDVKADMEGDLRNCRSKLFPTPFTFLPAPLGNYGNRILQIQTTDAIMRTFMAIAFIVLAARAPQMIDELLDVKKRGFTQNLGGVFGGAVSSVMGVAGIGLGAAPKLALGGLKFGVTKNLPGLSRVLGSKSVKTWAQKFGENHGSDPRQHASIAKIVGYMGGSNSRFATDKANSELNSAIKSLPANIDPRTGAVIHPEATLTSSGGGGAGGGGPYSSQLGGNPNGLSDFEAAIFKAQYLANNLDRLSSTTSTVSQAFTGLGSSVAVLQSQISDLGSQIQKFAALSAISDKI